MVGTGNYFLCVMFVYDKIVYKKQERNLYIDFSPVLLFPCSLKTTYMFIDG